MHLNDKEKTMFIIEWGVFVVVVMMFSPKDDANNVPKNKVKIFSDYILTFM